MNERIREFAEQTGYIWHASGDPQIYEFTPEKLEKFAELIVRECCQQLWAEECHISDLAYLDYKNKTNKIKRHFGVEA